MWVRWTRHLGDFERSVHLIFGFLSEERGYSEPAVKYGRDFFLVYTGGVGSSEGLEISIGWERDWFLPFISLGHEHLGAGGGVVDRPLQDVLRDLGVVVDTSRFPISAELSEETSGRRKLSIHRRYRRQLLEEYVPFLEEYGNVLKAHHDAIVDQLVSREAT